MKTMSVFCTLFVLFFIGIADAKTVGIFGSNSNAEITTFLTGEGHTVVDLNALGLTTANLTGVDSVLLLRTSGNADLATWVAAGGTLITEWSAADWALNVASLIDGTATLAGFIGGGTPITFTAAGLADPISGGVSNPFSDVPRTDFFYTLTSGVGSDVLATRPGDIGAIVAGSSGSGFVYVLGYDWADGPWGSANADTLQVLSNAIEPGVAPIPEPGTWALFGLGLLGVTAVARRRRRTA